MSFYEQYCLPHIINFVCGMKDTQRQRAKVVPRATGRVLEIGMGSGLNVPFYDRDKVDMVWGLEPSVAMRRKAASNLAGAPFEIRWLDLPGEEIPLDDDAADTVLLTYTLCTIPDWQRALEQMRRVLKPGGRLIFCEHGRAPDPAVRRWQERLNPVWNALGGGCNLNRPIPTLIDRGGFNIQEIEAQYRPGPKFASFQYWGTATGA
ncbi:MAG TPA: class I SAM-dependent methyltransferase [Gammaproteobacteria bacterium]|jgi:ubiquinone/menaquinone biosynthesis C-methylase UbiE|nr:class I SAM-dependent methyltransferase [Gammaproteobacteria bacterium]